MILLCYCYVQPLPKNPTLSVPLDPAQTTDVVTSAAVAAAALCLFPAAWLLIADSPMFETSKVFTHSLHFACWLSPRASQGYFWTHWLLTEHTFSAWDFGFPLLYEALSNLILPLVVMFYVKTSSSVYSEMKIQFPHCLSTVCPCSPGALRLSRSSVGDRMQAGRAPCAHASLLRRPVYGLVDGGRATCFCLCYLKKYSGV